MGRSDPKDEYLGYDTRLEWHTPELAGLVAAGVLPLGRVLDIGCGHGSESLFLAVNGWHVLGIDTDADAITLARARAKKLRFGVRRPQFRRTNATTFHERRPGTFNVVVEGLVYNNLGKEKAKLKFLQAAAYALGENGIFVLRLRCPSTHQSIRRPYPVVDPRRPREDRHLFGRRALHFLRTYFVPGSRRPTRFRSLVTDAGNADTGALLLRVEDFGILVLRRNGTRVPR
jgi:cyclopropane fatty-acyl-phospholipid synthase-like methyltransferase